jgi:hypothetical protein
MAHDCTKQQLFNILVRAGDWYVFPTRVREEYYPDFREAIEELIAEGRAERREIDGKAYFRARRPDSLVDASPASDQGHSFPDVAQPCTRT